MSIDIKAALSKAVKGTEPVVVKTGKLEKEEKPAPKKNGGVRPNSGRKPKASTLIERGIQEYVDAHINELVDVQIEDKKTGKKTIIKKARIAVVLQKLYSIGVSGDGSTEALKAWLDRALGKPITVIAGDSTKPIVLRLDI